MRKYIFLFIIIHLANYTYSQITPKGYKINFDKLLNGHYGKPPAIPMLINNKLILETMTEIMDAGVLELGTESNSNILINWLEEHSSNQNFVVKNLKAAQILTEGKSLISQIHLTRLNKLFKDSAFIKNMETLTKLKDQHKQYELAYFNQRMIVGKKLIETHPEFTMQEKNFIQFLIPELWIETLPLYAIGSDITGFKTSNKIYNLWKNEIKPFRVKFNTYEDKVKMMENKYIQPNLKIYGNALIVRLFNYGMVFYIDKKYNSRDEFLGSVDAIINSTY